MSTRKHGRNGWVKMDVSAGAAGLVLTKLPFVAEWTIDATSDRVDVTAMEDGNKVKLLGFKDFKLTFSGYAPDDSDVYRIIGDGQPRAFVLCDDGLAVGSKRYWSGLIGCDSSESGGQGKALSVSVTAEASGTIVETFGATEPDPLA